MDESPQQRHPHKLTDCVAMACRCCLQRLQARHRPPCCHAHNDVACCTHSVHVCVLCVNAVVGRVLALGLNTTESIHPCQLPQPQLYPPTLPSRPGFLGVPHPFPHTHTHTGARARACVRTHTHLQSGRPLTASKRMEAPCPHTTSAATCVSKCCVLCGPRALPMMVCVCTLCGSVRDVFAVTCMNRFYAHMHFARLCCHPGGAVRLDCMHWFFFWDVRELWPFLMALFVQLQTEEGLLKIS